MADEEGTRSLVDERPEIVVHIPEAEERPQAPPVVIPDRPVPWIERRGAPWVVLAASVALIALLLFVPAQTVDVAAAPEGGAAGTTAVATELDRAGDPGPRERSNPDGERGRQRRRAPGRRARVRRRRPLPRERGDGGRAHRPAGLQPSGVHHLVTDGCHRRGVHALSGERRAERRPGRTADVRRHGDAGPERLLDDGGIGGRLDRGRFGCLRERGAGDARDGRRRLHSQSGPHHGRCEAPPSWEHHRAEEVVA